MCLYIIIKEGVLTVNINLFKNRSFDLLWCAKSISLLGDSLFEIGLTLLIYDVTGSTVAMGMNLVMFFLPSLIFGFIGGIAADRYDRKLLMIVVDLLRGAILLIFPLFINEYSFSLMGIYVTTFILSALSQFYNPASGSIIPQLVGNDFLVPANSALNTTSQLIGIVGPALAGIIVRLYGTYATIYADSISFFLSAVFVMLIHVSTADVSPRYDNGFKGFYTDLKQGISYVVKRRDLIVILTLMFVLNSFLGPMNVILPVYADNTLGMEVTGYSMMLSGLSVGALIGAALVNFIVGFIGYGSMIVTGIAAIGIGLATLGIFQNLYYAVFTMAVVGVGVGLINVIISSQVQKTTPREYLGRVLSTLGVIGTATVPLSTAVVSVLLSYITANTYFITCGLLILAYFVWYFVSTRDYNTDTKVTYDIKKS